MRSSPKRVGPGHPPSYWKVIALAALGAALFLYFQSVVGVQLEDTPFFDLPPEPDAAEYFAGGVSIAREGTYRIHLAGEELPSRYPFGYSLLIAVWVRSGFVPTIEAPFGVNRLIGFVLLLLVFSLLWARGAYKAAGVGCLLLVTLPAFIVLCRSPMSEVSSGVLVFSGFCALYFSLSRSSMLWGLLGCILLGVSLWFKLSNLFFLPAVPLVILCFQGNLTERLKRGSVLFGGLTLSVIPLLLYHRSALGGVFRTGYSLWLPDQSAPLDIFHPSFLARNLLYLAQELTLNQSVTTVASKYGHGYYFASPFLLLCLLALWHYKKRRGFLLLSGAGLLYSAILLFYFFQDFRLFFPVMLMAVPWISRFWIEAFESSRTIFKFFLSLLLLAQLSIFPGSHIDPDFHRYMTPSRLNGPAPGYQLVQDYRSSSGDRPALILTDLNPAFVHGLLDSATIVSFLQNEHDYRFAREQFRYGDRERCEQLRSSMAQGIPVYGLVANPTDKSLANPCPELGAFTWQNRRLLSEGGLSAELHPSIP